MKRLFTITVLVAALGAVMAQAASAQGTQRLSKQELKSLLANAKTSEDHRKLAEHFRAEAGRLSAKAQQHEEQAELERMNPTPLAVKNRAAFGEQHCRNLAEHYRRKAAEMQSLAAMHENMARQ